MSKCYRVEFEVHANCAISEMCFFCVAKNIREAKEIARTEWENGGHKGHQFHLTAKHVPEDQEITTWKGGKYRANEIMIRFICVDYRVWRINGKSVY